MVFNNQNIKKFNSTNTEENNLIIKQTILNNKMNKNLNGNLIVSKHGIGGGGGGVVDNVTDVANGKKLSNEDKKINLNALKNQDPFATNIIDTAFRVAVYKFVSKKNEWVNI